MIQGGCVDRMQTEDIVSASKNRGIVPLGWSMFRQQIQVCLLAIGLFIWSIDNKQFEDLDREAQRILERDDD